MPLIFGNNIPLPGTVLNELFPIQMKGSPNRLLIPGVPQIETYYHNALEEGRKLEKSIGDAIFQIEVKKLDLEEKILHYLIMTLLATDGQFMAFDGTIFVRITPTLDCRAHIQVIQPDRPGLDFGSKG